VGFIGDRGVGADSLPRQRLEPADLRFTLSEDRASEWSKPSTVSSDRCDLRRRDLECSLGNVAYVRAPDLRLPHHWSGAFFGLKETIRNVDGIKSDLAPDLGPLSSAGAILIAEPEPTIGQTFIANPSNPSEREGQGRA
jgi:hypothetical protein